jgi:two-component system, OmpR family, alkaline phosphatase synthesis response regulator PhoP
MLRRAGHDVITAADGYAALSSWREHKPELILLDVGLPGPDGWEVCKTVKKESATPVMIVSGNDREDDMVRGFDVGAEDYICKPFSPRLLQARISSLLQRSKSSVASQSSDSSRLGDLSIDSRWRTASCGERTARLTPLEYRVLRELSLHAGRVVPHSDLIEKIWGYRDEASSSVVKGHIRSVRLKLAKLGSSASIRIVPSVGYILEART